MNATDGKVAVCSGREPGELLALIVQPESAEPSPPSGDLASRRQTDSEDSTPLGSGNATQASRGPFYSRLPSVTAAGTTDGSTHESRNYSLGTTIREL
ncbi:hypothetical protein EYF80_042261 [Liparis tanakae]|uniref:Uncharacterized protein n=1 Tax=Liparis tanakae TaxID=230148 RepID=A0A4Z2G2Z0_9TELE|nr:hypothetical protein EYF80_042261 [Liparis tanakae]